ncbi:MAG: ATP-binding cassette domain-containing protein, partial [Deltaproteobacteria bacterium]|nr:ATP-binding cassette domain-containing protein [Deltaproteobacteria bacterium]
MERTECVKTQDVKRSFLQGAETVEALRDVDLTVYKGEFIALIGESGSGKTTLLNVLGGLDRPDSGAVYIEGRDITSLTSTELSKMRLKRVGFIFQEYNLIPVLSAVENVEYVLLLQGVSEKERRERSIAILDEVGLKGMYGRRPGELSGGQQQRV